MSVHMSHRKRGFVMPHTLQMYAGSVRRRFGPFPIQKHSYPVHIPKQASNESHLHGTL